MDKNRIKIRLWDKRLRKMMYFGEDAQLCWEYGAFSLYLNKGQEQLQREISFVSSDEDCEIMHVIDMNGNDVYEGDVVKLYDERMPKEMREQIVSVTFENGCFMFGGFFPYGLVGQEVVVIGNIYEHPELLEARG